MARSRSGGRSGGRAGGRSSSSSRSAPSKTAVAPVKQQPSTAVAPQQQSNARPGMLGSIMQTAAGVAGGHVIGNKKFNSGSQFLLHHFN